MMQRFRMCLTNVHPMLQVCILYCRHSLICNEFYQNLLGQFLSLQGLPSNALQFTKQQRQVYWLSCLPLKETITQLKAHKSGELYSAKASSVSLTVVTDFKNLLQFHPKGEAPIAIAN